MIEIEKFFENHLKKDTDFAVQINGNWGSGKTYFYKNVLENQIIKTKTFFDERKSYKPVYISLFGLKSVDEIATKIVFEFYQSKYFNKYFDKNSGSNTIKISSTILKIGFKGFLNFHKLGNVNEYLTEIGKIGKGALDAREILICFDDLERKDTSLKIEDLTGYINSLIDEGVKVLLISNEDLLKEETQFTNLKEKIIGITLEFQSNTEQTLNSIIENRYQTFKTYKDYLKSKIPDLTLILKSIDYNYRHLNYALDCHQIIYSSLLDQVIETNDEIKEKLIEQLNNIFYCTLAFAIEFKSSFISHKDKKKFNNENRILDKLLELNGRSEQSYLDKFITKYGIKSENYHFFDSIFSHVTGVKEFSHEKFIKEFKSEFKLDKGEILPQYKLYEELCLPNCLDFSDQIYAEKVSEIIKYAEKGLFSSIYYVNIMIIAESFDNSSSLNLDDVYFNLSKGLKISINKLNSRFNKEKSGFMLAQEQQKSLSELQRNLYQIGNEEFRSLEISTKENQVKTYVDLFLENNQEFQTRYNGEIEFRKQINQYHFLNQFDSKKLEGFLELSDLSRLYFFESFLLDRFDKNILFPELGLLDSISKKLNEIKTNLDRENPKSRKVFLVKKLLNTIGQIVLKAHAPF